MTMLLNQIEEHEHDSQGVAEEVTACSFCKGNNILFDAERGEKLCSNCGIVLAEGVETEDLGLDTKDRIDTTLHNGISSSLMTYDKGLSTVIPFANTDGNGVALNAEQRSSAQRMRKWNTISNSNRSYHRNLKNAFAIIIRIKDKLSLSDPLIEKSAYYYRKVIDLDIIKGRSIKGFVVGCVYAACRESNIPRTIEEVAEVADADKVFASKCYRLLVRRLKLRLPEIDGTSHLAKIANNAMISEKTVRRAAEMMSVMKQDPISFGKDPGALASAVLYAACLEQGEKIAQGHVASAANVSIVTLRKRFIDVRKVFPNVPNGPTDLALVKARN